MPRGSVTALINYLHRELKRDIEHDFGQIFVIQAFVQKPFQHTAEYVMKFDIYPPLTSPTDFSTDFCALPEDRGPVGGAGGRTERHVAVLARPPCPHDTYPQFGSRGEEQGGTCWPSTAAPPRDAKTQGISQNNRRTTVLAHPHSENASARVRRN